MTEPRNIGCERVVGINILDPQQLLQMAQDTTEVGRYRLANAVSQFFEQRELNEAERRLASGIMMSLIHQAEMDLRQSLAERLAVLENVPSEIITYLANDEIPVARPILLHSPVLNDVDLIYIISAKGSEHWQTIAARERLSPTVVERLIDTEDSGTMRGLIDNKCIILQKSSLKKIIKAALRSEELQVPLLARPEVDGELVADLYVCVSNALRQQISERFHVPVSVAETALEKLVEELCQEARGVRQVTPEMQALAKRFAENDRISAETMVKTLRRGQVSFFIALFAQKVGFEPDAVVRMIQKDGGKPFAMACRSIGMMKSEFASIFLLSRGIRTGDKIVDQRELAMALKYYDGVKEYDVQRLMQSWAKNPELI